MAGVSHGPATMFELQLSSGPIVASDCGLRSTDRTFASSAYLKHPRGRFFRAAVFLNATYHLLSSVIRGGPLHGVVRHIPFGKVGVAD